MENSDDPYRERKQTEVKHFVLKSYLQALAFKVLTSRDDIAYVDGFSGPWQSTTENFSDTSFKIALDALVEAQNYFKQKRGESKHIRCFFVEKDPSAFALLNEAVQPYNLPENGFAVSCHHGEFENSVPRILEFVDRSFTLLFIDPTGWTGYSYEKIGPLLRHKPGEVLINFMFDFINRFAESQDPSIEASLDPILGGSGWKMRLDRGLPRGRAVEKLFREELQKAGDFQYVTSTCIDKATVNRPHFFLAYGTRHEKGLVAFRQVEFDALRRYEKVRASVKQAKKEEKTGQKIQFPPEELPENTPLVDIIDALKEEAKPLVIRYLKAHGGSMEFSQLRLAILQTFMLRETDAKDICVGLSKEGIIVPTWKQRGNQFQKPNLSDVIILYRK